MEVFCAMLDETGFVGVEAALFLESGTYAALCRCKEVLFGL